MNFVKTITSGFLNRWHIRFELAVAKEEINSYGASILECGKLGDGEPRSGEGAEAKMTYTEKWRPFYSVFVITCTNFPKRHEEFLDEWIDEILNIEID